MLGSYRLTAVLLLAMPQLIMTFLTSWLTGRALEARAGWRHAWATVVALICSLAVGAVYLTLLGRALGFPSR